MGGRNIPHLYTYIKNNIMKIEKRIIKESAGVQNLNKKSFSTKKQNIIITESQLEYILSKLNK